jgi:hypothetical protein
LDQPGEAGRDTGELRIVNDHFIQSELEYRRQQRLAAAAEYRRARSARRVRHLRGRLGAVVEGLLAGRQHGRHARGSGTAHAA